MAVATTDELTGLLNRREIMRVLEVEITRVARQHTPLSIMMLDLDHFKSINDDFGHQGGDRALEQAAIHFQQIIRSTDFAGRVGGEEFLIILPDTGLNNAHELAERIRLTAAGAADNKATPGCTVSIGIAQFRQDDTQHSLIQRADEALYKAKADGRNCVAVKP